MHTHTRSWTAVEAVGDRVGQARALQRVHDAFTSSRRTQATG